MKRNALAFLALVTACGGGSVGETDTRDASSDAAASLTDGATDGGDAGPDPCAGQSVPPSTLACTGLYADFATKELSPSAAAYTPAALLWSDGAQKARWIELPANTKIDITNPDEWTFPIGTKVFKEFRIEGKRVETRLFQKTTATFWAYATYAWNSDDSAATINYGGTVPVAGTDGGTWTIPTNDDCDECHRGRQDRVLGFEQVGLGLPGAQGLTLAQLVAQGLVQPAPATTSLQIGDDGTGLDSLAMGWMHMNCGVTCHNSNPSAAGYGAGMLLRLHPAQLDGTAPSAATWDFLKTTINVPAVSGGLTGNRIVPGDPADSIAYQLMDERGSVQMPPIGTAIVDTPDVAVVRAWIQAMGTTSPDDGGLGDDGGDGGEIMDAGERDGGHHRDSGLGDAATEDSGADTGVADAQGAGDSSSASDTGTDSGALDAGSDATIATDAGPGVDAADEDAGSD